MMDIEQVDTSDSESAQRDNTGLKDAMINKLAHTDAHFKHQTRGEPDLEVEEKYAIAHDLLERNAGLFLERFYTYLTVDDIKCFSHLKDDYLVNFYVDKIKEVCGGRNKNVIKNRRFQAIQEMMDEGEYFSDAKMQSRDPLLYEQMVGQYETDEEKQAKDVDKSDLRFSSILLKYMDKQEMKNRYDRMKEREEGQEEETDEDTEDEVEEDEDENKNRKGDEEGAKATERERVEMHNEFLHIMQERFLSGEDSQFDYSQVDDNAQYDSLVILNRDAEERYFDKDDSNSS